MQDKISDQVAARIRSIRKSHKWSRDDLAACCVRLDHPEITVAVIESIETGRPGPDGVRRRDITIDELMIIARALGVHWDALVDGSAHGRIRNLQSVEQLERMASELHEMVSALRENGFSMDTGDELEVSWRGQDAPLPPPLPGDDIFTRRWKKA